MLHLMSQIQTPLCAFRPQLMRQPCVRSEIQHQPAANPKIPDPPPPGAQNARTHTRYGPVRSGWICTRIFVHIFSHDLSVYIVKGLDHKCNLFWENLLLDVLKKRGLIEPGQHIYTKIDCLFRLVSSGGASLAQGLGTGPGQRAGPSKSCPLKGAFGCSRLDSPRNANRHTSPMCSGKKMQLLNAGIGCIVLLQTSLAATLPRQKSPCRATKASPRRLHMSN